MVIIFSPCYEIEKALRFLNYRMAIDITYSVVGLIPVQRSELSFNKRVSVCELFFEVLELSIQIVGQSFTVSFDKIYIAIKVCRFFSENSLYSLM